MLYTIILIFLMITSLMFMQMNHPLTMMFMLLIQTILMSMLMGMMSQTFWFSYILFLMFLGGMLVLFIYMTAIASNEMFSLSMKMFFNMIILFISLVMLSKYIDKSLFMSFNNNMETLSNSTKEMMLNENTINLNKLYNMPTNYITIMLVYYLLLTLITTIKITNVYFGALRTMN